MLIHIVRMGDTLASIAERYGVSVARLRADNGITSDRLVVGQALIVMLPSQVHTVKAGETLSSIASIYGITVIELIQNNPALAISRVLYPGQTLTISFQGEKIRTIAINGYAYPHIERMTLRRALPYLTYLSVFSYGFKESGELIVPDDAALLSTAKEFRSAPVLVFTSIDENGGFSSERASRLFNDPALQNRILDEIIAVMKTKGYVGMDADFEYIRTEDAEGFFGFLGNAAARLHSEGFFLSVALAPKTSASQAGLLYEAHDYSAIGGIADHVLLMTYEWGYAYGPPMAVAPINQVRSVVQYAVTEIPPAKINLGIPNYGYDWTLPFEREGSRATTIGNEEAIQIAERNGAEIRFDEAAMSPFFNYTAFGNKHVVWFEDVRSVQAKYDLADEFALAGVGYWSIMRPFAQNWAYISAKYRVEKVL